MNAAIASSIATEGPLRIIARHGVLLAPKLWFLAEFPMILAATPSSRLCWVKTEGICDQPILNGTKQMDQ
jgi:hypothetical protein